MNDGSPRVYLDANVLIGVVEIGPDLSAGQRGFLSALDDGRMQPVSSELSLSEVLVQPFMINDRQMAETFQALLAMDGSLEVVPVTREVLIGAARQRAQTRMNLPDSIHVATAELAGCVQFVSSDRGVRLPHGMRAVVWSQLSAMPGDGL